MVSMAERIRRGSMSGKYEYKGKKTGNERQETEDKDSKNKKAKGKSQNCK